MLPYTMRMRLMFLGSGNALGRALIRLGAEENIGFLVPRPPRQGWDTASLTTLLDETRPDAAISLVFYHDWFQAKQAEAGCLGVQERVVERLAELYQYYRILLVQPSSYRVFDGARATAYSEKDETLPLGPRGQAPWCMKQSVCAACPRHVLIRFDWLLDESPNGLLGCFLSRAEQPQPLFLTDDRRGNPTLADNTVRVVFSVLKQLGCQVPLRGAYHYGGLEVTTTPALGQMILNEARTYRSNLIQESSTEVHAACPDALDESQHAVMVCKKILHTFGIKPRAWCAGSSTPSDRHYGHV